MCVKLSPENLNSDPYPPHPHKHLNSDIFNTMLIHVASNQNNNNLNNKTTFTYVSLWVKSRNSGFHFFDG